MMADICIGTLMSFSRTIAMITPTRIAAQIIILRGSFTSSFLSAAPSGTTAMFCGQSLRPTVSM